MSASGDRRTPGVYREEQVLARPPALATGVPLFLGRARLGDGGGAMPRVFRRWPDFATWAGGPTPGYLDAAVRGFFENGGEICYVAPLDDWTPEALAGALGRAERLEAIDLVCAPDISLGPSGDAIVAMLQAVLQHCADRGDRFAILDLPRSAWPGRLPEEWSGTLGASGACYLPWLRVPDPGGTRIVPPCGHVAGVYAATDRRAGVYRAPANVALQGVLGLETSFTDAQQAQLPESLNVVRDFRGRGTLLWGARTLSAEPAWRYVSVSRLFITVGRWARQNLASVVFEPNDRRLWARVERELSAYCACLLRRGALAGARAEEAFFVRCDAATNPLAARDAGQLTAEVGLAPTLPNEFVVVRIIAEPGGVTLALRSEQARLRDRGR